MIIEGKKLQQEILKKLLKIRPKKTKIRLASIYLKSDPATLTFLKNKAHLAQKLKVEYKKIKIKSNTSFKELKEEIKKISQKFDALSIQLPLPKKFSKDTQKILDLIPLKKDLEALNSTFFEKKLYQKLKIFPPSVKTLEFLLKKYRISLKNKRIVLLGQGILIGQPIKNYLKMKKINFEIIEKSTPQKIREKILKKAEVVISGMGQAHLIKASQLKKAKVVIDFGTSFKKGKIYGDIKPDISLKKFKIFTPVPGGTAPILVAMLFENLFLLRLTKTSTGRN